MKEKLEELAQELIKEVRDVKDLTKKELPEIAKEYITYNITFSKVVTIVSGVVLILSLIGAILAIFVLRSDSFAVGVGMLSFLTGMFSFFAFCSEYTSYLSFKMQPRRMAIKAITSLFN